MKPLVSVILPVRNGADGLARAMKSVLKQTFRNLELIVVDDGSRDSTPDIAHSIGRKDKRVRIIRRKSSKGIVAALNTGMSAARGEHVARIDHDDVWIARTKLAKQVAVLRKDPRLAIVGTGVLVVKERTGRQIVRRPPRSVSAIRAEMLRSCPFVHSSVVFRRKAALAVGGYRTGYPHAEDYFLWLRIGRNWRMANLPFIGVRYSWRPGGVSASSRFTQWMSRLRLIFRFRKDYPKGYRGLTFNLLEAVWDVSLNPARWLWDRISALSLSR